MSTSALIIDDIPPPNQQNIEQIIQWPQRTPTKRTPKQPQNQAIFEGQTMDQMKTNQKTHKNHTHPNTHQTQQDPLYLIPDNWSTGQTKLMKPLQSSQAEQQANSLSPSPNGPQSDTTRKSSSTTDQLEQQKQQLMQSLRILKRSAISVIAQKEDELSLLKSSQLVSSEQEISFYRQQMQKCLSSQHQLQQNHLELEAELRLQKETMSNQLADKQQKIQELLNIIQQLRIYIHQVENNEHQYLREIRRLEEQIETLQTELNEHARDAAIDQPETVELKQNHLQCSHQVQITIEQSEIYRQATLSQPSKLAQPTLHQLQQQHRFELIKLASFYQNKIKNLTKSQTLHQSFKDIEEEGLEHSLKSVTRSKSQADNKPIDKSPSLKYLDLASEASVHNLHEEIATPRTNQDNEIFNLANRQTFDLPFLFHKHKSSMSFEGPSESCRIRMAQKQTKQTQYVDSCAQLKKMQEKIIDLLWQKTKAFATGFLSGASLGSIISFLLLKRKR